jgi:hypothetical protein
MPTYKLEVRVDAGQDLLATEPTGWSIRSLLLPSTWCGLVLASCLIGCDGSGGLGDSALKTELDVARLARKVEELRAMIEKFDSPGPSEDVAELRRRLDGLEAIVTRNAENIDQLADNLSSVIATASGLAQRMSGAQGVGERPRSAVRQEEPDAPAPRVVAQNDTYRVGQFGTGQISGEVYNGSGKSIDWVKVIATFYDGSGQVIETGFSFSQPRAIEAFGTAAFSILVTEEEIASRIVTYKLAVEWK